MKTGIHFHGKLAYLELIEVHGQPHASDVVILKVQVSEKTIDLVKALKLEGVHGQIEPGRPEVEVTIAVDE